VSVRPTAALLLRLPEPGKVKTRLARSVGPEAATRVYAAMARGLVERLRDGPWALAIHHTPSTPEAAAELRGWLEAPDSEASFRFHGQPEGDLGMRMEHALSAGIAPGAPAAVLATDVPGLGPRQVGRAFDKLEANEADLVLGPCPDGGFYLLAVARSPAPPELFRDHPWSTAEVLDRTVRIAGSMGLRVHLLEPLVDVDEVEDLAGTGLEALLGSPNDAG
jgi:uncharacterized protein